MISDQLATILRSSMVVAGAFGFVLGMGLGIWRGTDLSMAIFRGAGLCVLFTLIVRFLVVRLFRAHLDQLQVRRKDQNKSLSEEAKNKS
jgi:hypothetical protein